MTRMDDAVARDLAGAPAAPPVAAFKTRARRKRRRRMAVTFTFAAVVLMALVAVAASLGRKASA